ncbi:MAG: RraA family protein [Acidobacteriota bacterium]|nr:RraA family protein [Acidobacteriota bacterium]
MSGASEADLVERLGRLDSCAVSDALDKLGLKGAVAGIVPLTCVRRISGKVLTIRLGVGEPPRGTPRHIGTTAIETAEPGNIIVVEQRSGLNAAAWGGILSRGAKLRGIAGTIAEGPVRDVDEARETDYPVYGRGATVSTARDRIVELANNQPIAVGDVTVKAGDYAIADSSGVVFVAAEEIGRVLPAAEDIAAREAAMTKALLDGEPITKVMGANYENMLRR